LRAWDRRQRRERASGAIALDAAVGELVSAMVAVLQATRIAGSENRRVTWPFRDQILT